MPSSPGSATEQCPFWVRAYVLAVMITLPLDWFAPTYFYSPPVFAAALIVAMSGGAALAPQRVAVSAATPRKTA